MSGDLPFILQVHFRLATAKKKTRASTNVLQRTPSASRYRTCPPFTSEVTIDRLVSSRPSFFLSSVLLSTSGRFSFVSVCPFFHFNSLNVVRRVPPYFSMPFQSIYEVKPGSSLNITCVAGGSPMPFVKWRKGLEDLEPEHSLPIGRNILVLEDIQESANYTCVASSKLGNVENTTFVRVEGTFEF